jgi:PAS domain S-box-containing protein
MIGRRLFDFVHSESREGFSACMNHLREPSETRLRQKQNHVTLDGSIIALELGFARIEYSGENVTLVIAREISARGH